MAFPSVAAFSAPASGSVRLDAKMLETYDNLAREAIASFEKKSGDQAYWIGVTGGPGSGKSTLGDAVAERIQELGVEAISVPMDGYHLSKAEMAERGFDMKRRGAPWTFDANKLFHELMIGKQTGKASLPTYSRKISDPVPDQVRLEEKHRIIVVEGNYLTLGATLPEVDVEGSTLMERGADLGCPYPLREEIERWKPALDLWDETWFVGPKGGFMEQRRRLIERTLQTWTPEKTEMWGGGTDREAATTRVEFNDFKNAKFIECCAAYADRVIESK